MKVPLKLVIAILMIIGVLLFLTQLPAPLPVTQAESRLSELSAITEVHSISIHRVQEYGITNCPWVDETLTLERTSQNFEGEIKFRVRAPLLAPPIRETTEQVAIPLDVVNTFLETLATTTLESRTQKMPIWATDGWKFSIDILLESNANRTMLSMQSTKGFQDLSWQAKSGDSSWFANAMEKNYSIRSDAPLRGLALLQPYMKAEVLQRLSGENNPCQ